MNIAIRGHESRGKEVIQILESLGGRNDANLKGTSKKCYYFIDLNSTIDCTEYASKNIHTYTLEKFEKKFPFKVGDEVTIVGLPDFPKVITQMIWDCDEILYSFESLNNTWFGAKSLKKFEMKEERNITLTLDKAKEWYQKGGELKEIALQAYSEEELTKKEFPKTWDEFCENYPVRKGECWLGGQDNILNCAVPDDGIYRKYKNWIPSEKSAEAHLAMIQLEQLRDCWRQGWEPTPGNSYYTIKSGFKGLSVYSFCTVEFLSFLTKEMAEEFLRCFRDLIEKAGDLI